MNRRVVAPNAEVHTPSGETLRQLFFSPVPSFVPLGAVETFGEQEVAEVPVTLDGDQLVTKHFCVFGMTGSGKTNTAAKLVEEFMARGHRMVIFDSHDDYQNLETFSNLFRDFDANGQVVELIRPQSHDDAVQAAMRLNPTAVPGREAEKSVYERRLRLASIVYGNTPARQFLARSDQRMTQNGITPEFVGALANTEPWRELLMNPQVASFRHFPELRFYGNNFEDFTIILLQAFQGESFSSAQWRCLRQYINQQGTGINYLQNLWRAVRNDQGAQQVTRDALLQMINGIQAIYGDARNAGTQPLDLAGFFRRVADRSNSDSHTVYRLSLTDLSSNLRKAMVYGIVTYFFRSFKFGGFRARARDDQPPNAYPVLFVLEEARALIPRSSGTVDLDVAGRIARNAMRELAYEGRKFSLGFGLISQKPSTVDQEVVSQSNTFILHQLKSPDDQGYVRMVTESMSREELDMIKGLAPEEPLSQVLPFALRCSCGCTSVIARRVFRNRHPSEMSLVALINCGSNSASLTPKRHIEEMKTYPIPFLVADRPISLSIIKGISLPPGSRVGILTQAATTTDQFKKLYCDYPFATDVIYHNGEPSDESIKERTIKMVDSGVFGKNGCRLSYEGLFTEYNKMEAHYGIMIDAFRDAKGTIDSAKIAMKKYRQSNWNFKLVGVAQGNDVDDYFRCYEFLQKLGFEYIAVGGLLQKRVNTARYVNVRCKALLESVLRGIRQRFDPKWLFPLGAFHPDRLELFTDVGVWGSDYKGWIFNYEKKTP